MHLSLLSTHFTTRSDIESRQQSAFHPGRGVYRSSYKNARRLAATETNMAYRNADFTRWQNMPFVVGIKVQLSNNHTLNGEPFVDICDHLKGDYPKDFEFVGWHPLCRCFATPILMTEEEFNADLKRRLKGQPSEPERSVNFVSKPPEGFNKWVIDHADRIASAKSLPYYIRQNQPFVEAALAPKELIALEVTKQQRFIAAKSMQEAQERAVRCGIDRVDFGSATIDEANIALEVIEAEARGRSLNLSEFNIKSSVAETLNAKGAIGGAYNSDKRTLSMDISIFRESIYKKPQSWEERISNIEAKIAKNKAEIAKFEGYLGRSKATDKELKPHIAHLKQQNLGFEKQVYQYTKLKEQGTPSYSLTVAEQFESIDDQARAQIYHEFGHYVDDVLGRPSQKGIRESISQYGEKADNESFAEWYAHYRMNGPSGVPDELLEVFRGYDRRVASTPRLGGSYSGTKLGRSATKEAYKEYLDAPVTTLTKEQKENIDQIAASLGIKAKPMTFEEANNGRANVNWRKETQYKENCQCCVIVHEARLRGLNVTSVGYNRNPKSIQYALGDNFQIAWRNPKTGAIPNLSILQKDNRSDFYKKVDKALSAKGRYHIGINYKDGKGHLLTAERMPSGSLAIYDAQNGEFINPRDLSSERVGYLEVLKIDNLLFDMDIITKIVQVL